MAGRAFRSPRAPKGLALGVCIGLAVLAVIVAATYFLSSSSGSRSRRHATPELLGPLSPGVTVRDMGSGRSKCMSCEDQAGVQGGVSKCLTCTQPSFKYLTETIIAEQGAAANGACHACRGAP